MSSSLYPPIVYTQPPPAEPGYPGYNAKAAGALGIARLVTASVLILVQAVALTLVAMDWQVTGWGSLIGVGIWGGALYILAASFGIASSEKPTKASITSHLALTALGLTFIPVLLVAFSVVAINEATTTRGHHCADYGDCAQRPFVICYQEVFCARLTTVIELNIVLMVMCGLHTGFDIAAAVLCCRALGCCSPLPPPHAAQHPPPDPASFGNPQESMAQGHYPQSELPPAYQMSPLELDNPAFTSPYEKFGPPPQYS